MESGDDVVAGTAAGSREPDPGLLRWRVVSPIVIAGETIRAGAIVDLPADSPRVRARHVVPADDDGPSPEIVAALEAAQAEWASS